ncbi:MAG TPA: HAMP domain-containing protein, partial [Anaerolineae bacterium]|nr:HAMP domain-containing protein [Anaerolineae bacterium]
MFRSVRWRLILNSLLITVVAIIAVGMVTLLLIGRYFRQQEQLYLVQRSETVLPIFNAFTRISQPDALAEIVTLTALFGDIRVEVLDTNGMVLADSGPREPGRPFIPGDGRVDTGRFSLVLQPSGELKVVRKPIVAETRSPFATEPNLVFSAESPITSISSVQLTFPIRNSQSEVIGSLRLSEGPAAGEGVIRGIRSALIGGSITALVVAIIVGSLSAEQIVRPLRKLENAVTAMAADDLSARAPQGNLSEYNQLATQFNKMADQLSGNIARLESERAVLKRMIADASHELRTPLTALKTFNTLLQ